jgi:hypothetical protein
MHQLIKLSYGCPTSSGLIYNQRAERFSVNRYIKYPKISLEEDMVTMKKITFTIAIYLAAILLTACAPSASSIQAAIQQTKDAWTPVPTQTPLPTLTPLFTYTPYPTFTSYPTQTPLATYTSVPTIAVEVTRIVMVTPTSTATPLYTPTITPTATKTGTPTRTPNTTQTAQAKLLAKLQADKGDGFYLVNVDIAPGVWRSNGKGDKCYWATTTKTGDIIDNHYGMAGGTAFIPATAFQVEFSKCGTWSYISP